MTIRTSLRYQAPLGDEWEVMAKAVHSIYHGHVEGENSTGGLVRLQYEVLKELERSEQDELAGTGVKRCQVVQRLSAVG